MTQPATDPCTSAVITLTGDFDLFSRRAFLAEVERLGQDEVTQVTIDMAGVQFLSSAGFAALIKAQRVLNRRGGGLTISRPSTAVRSTFEALGLCGLLSVFDDSDLGQQSLGS